MANGTKYEIILKSEKTGAVYLVGYTGRKSRQGVLDMLRHRRDAVMALCQFTDHGTLSKVPGGFRFVEDHDTWTAKFTNRTKREALQMGEVVSMPEPAGV